MHEDRTCPVWVGYLLVNPLRTLYQNPDRIVGPYVKKGMTVLDFGCAMGFFTLAMARMVGPEGRVIALDVQEKMVEKLLKRARKAGLADVIEAQVIPAGTADLEDREGTLDFILAFAVIHEVPEPDRHFQEFYALLKPGGKMLIAEPRGHVDGAAFRETLETARRNGFKVMDAPKIFRSYSALAQKPPMPLH